MTGPRRTQIRRCARCKAQIVWARTVAGPNGPGGKPMPLDARPDPEGNVAATIGPGHTIRARVLGKDEDHDHTHEWRAMPHFPTCTKNLEDAAAKTAAEQAPQLLDEIADYLRTTTSTGGTA